MPTADLIDRVLREVEAAADENVSFAADLIRVPTVNPPGDAYEDCAHVIGDRLRMIGFDVEYLAAEGRPEHTARHPRVNVVGAWRGQADHPLVHLNGHFDVVPAGDGWTLDPFGGIVRDGRVYGRGSCDMKAGIAAAVYAAAAIRRAGVTLPRHRRGERHRRRGERRLRRRRLARRARPAVGRPDRLRDHPRTAERRPDLRRPPRRGTGAR